MGRHKIDMSYRICSNCKSDETYIINNKYSNWHRNNDKLYCHNCYMRLLQGPKYKSINDVKRILYKNRRIQLKENPRVGACNLCKKEGRTEIHHIQYHDSNPLEDTIELCTSCHTKTKPRGNNGRFL